MRKEITYMYSLAIAAVMFSGCAGNHLDDVSTSRDFLFHVAVMPCTKTVNECEYPSDAQFGVWSFENGGLTYLDNEKVCYDEDNMWLPENRKSWDGDVDKMDFIAYSPYGRGTYVQDNGIVFSSYDISEGLDVMYSEPLTEQDREASQAVVHINMKRALALVKFKARAVVPESTTIVIKKVEVDGVYGLASFQSLPEPSWSGHSASREFCFFEGEVEAGGDVVALGEGMFMIPQTSEVQVNVLCDIITGDLKLSDQTLNAVMMAGWRPGKIASYVIKVDGYLNVTIEKNNE